MCRWLNDTVGGGFGPEHRGGDLGEPHGGVTPIMTSGSSP